ncbi:sulfite exporter TauE/SafE family protein [Streptomyces turgidiscabies]|uniref:Probable membrane transporter protein n=1 Tax=Streptomyces turgidiscabies TaxID=85558 RepID=A0ABU0RGQ6_9ACTN|nr:sulfite exporter TauE/SafE family protein [Streptomyces turgidiscabies]MDQ0931159.1 putative membrane protein YfcA [Streptomyces turgidiscabies]
MIALVIAASLVVGVNLGILGGGGSVLTVPILVYLAGQDTKEAIATSLFVVGVTSLAALIPHARAHRVRWRTGLLFGAFSMAGAYGGGRVAEYVPGTALLVAFAAMMLATAAAMLRRSRHPGEPKPPHRDLPLGHVAVEGLVVGAVTGLVGSGGGFLVVPALAILGGLPMSIAVGTSLLVIAMNSFAGLAGHLTDVRIDWSLALTVTAAAVAGSVIGARFAGRIPQDTLRRTFGWFVVAMGVLVLTQQLDTGVWTHPATWAGLGTVLLGVTAARVRQTRRAASTTSGRDSRRRARSPRRPAGRGDHKAAI